MTSRIRRHIEQQSRKTMYLSILGSIIVIGFLLIYGVPLFTQFVVFISPEKGAKVTANSTTVSYIAPPVLNDTYIATNSATVTISGSGLPSQNIKLFVNGLYTDEQSTDANGNVAFPNVSLTLGSNTVTAKALDSHGKESDYSNTLTITYMNKGPSLTINSPSDNQTISGGNGMLVVQGKTDPNVKITVNGFWAIVDGQGNFSYSLPLQGGNNQITIIATDDAGNSTTSQKSVTYNH